MSKNKLGDTVWIKAVVTGIENFGFEIGYGFHNQKYEYNTLAVYTKEEALEELQRPELPKVGEFWIYFKEAETSSSYQKKVIAVTDNNVFLEPSNGSRGEAYDLQDFLRTHVRVSEAQKDRLSYEPR